MNIPPAQSLSVMGRASMSEACTMSYSRVQANEETQSYPANIHTD